MGHNQEIELKVMANLIDPIEKRYGQFRDAGKWDIYIQDMVEDLGEFPADVLADAFTSVRRDWVKASPPDVRTLRLAAQGIVAGRKKAEAVERAKSGKAQVVTMTTGRANGLAMAYARRRVREGYRIDGLLLSKVEFAVQCCAYWQILDGCEPNVSDLPDWFTCKLLEGHSPRNLAHNWWKGEKNHAA